MNLQKLFETQKVLMERIEKEHPRKEGEDRFDKKVLALLVEVGECANEQRSWKYWSNDKKPRTHQAYFGYQKGIEFHGPTLITKNPLLEEYVDGLHFVLELGIELKFEAYFNIGKVRGAKEEINQLFIDIYETIGLVRRSRNYVHYTILFEEYLLLGELLGFTWEQIERAYYEKNAINHQRQEEGY